MRFYLNFLKDFTNIGGSGLLKHYKNSVVLLISSIYPEYEWLPWRFSHVPNGYWDDMKNQRNFMDWVAGKLNFKNREDWYKITKGVINFKLKF